MFLVCIIGWKDQTAAIVFTCLFDFVKKIVENSDAEVAFQNMCLFLFL